MKIVKLLMKLAKAVGYGAMGLFLYIDFIGPSGLLDLIQSTGLHKDLKMTAEGSQFGALMITTRLVYTSIGVAALEVFDNMLEMVNLHN